MLITEKMVFTHLVANQEGPEKKASRFVLFHRFTVSSKNCSIRPVNKTVRPPSGKFSARVFGQVLLQKAPMK